jgi:hypothetical protein
MNPTRIAKPYMAKRPLSPLTPVVRRGHLSCMARPALLPPSQLSRVLLAADVSGRTLRRYLAGASLLGSSLRRIEAALRAEGLERLVQARAAKLHEAGATAGLRAAS